MNSAAHDLGLGSTHFVDVSGLDPGSVSTPDDLIRLGQAAMAIPAFSSVVNMAQADLPVAGVVHNFDYDLGHDGMVGIKTGSDSAAGGCFLFEARQSVGATTMTLVGAVLGQQTASPLSAALDEAEALTKAAFASMGTFPLVPAGHVVGTIVDALGRVGTGDGAGIAEHCELARSRCARPRARRGAAGGYPKRHPGRRARRRPQWPRDRRGSANGAVVFPAPRRAGDSRVRRRSRPVGWCRANRGRSVSD